MALLIQGLLVAIGFISMGSFAGALVSGLLLVPYYDDGNERSWFARSQCSANPALGREFYRKEGWVLS